MPYRVDCCFILREVNVLFCPLAALFQIICKNVATSEWQRGGGGVVVGGDGSFYYC